MDRQELVRALYESIGEECVTAGDVAHVEVHGNEVLGLHLVPGLEVEAEEQDEGLDVSVVVRKGARIEQPVRICFGVLPESGIQRIDMTTRMEDDSRVAILASCTFPNAVDVLHTMDAEITIGRGAEYVYLERHVHGEEGGVRVVPKATITLEEGASFRTDFELVRGSVGEIDFDYAATCHTGSVLEMAARVSARGDDRVRIHEKADLVGEGARGVLTTNIAVRDTAQADIRNTLTASAPGARGHVDCKEIVQGEAVAKAVPIVEVRHPKAHVTHEAAIGSVDSKQLETLMTRGLSEDDATELIIGGLLSPSY
ncbi:MAG: SufBD protein [Candidatus Eisenbacteria bacterium]|nr:SufBD protein [Candidatus Eisenbacteria bacterium]